MYALGDPDSMSFVHITTMQSAVLNHDGQDNAQFFQFEKHSFYAEAEAQISLTENCAEINI